MTGKNQYYLLLQEFKEVIRQQNWYPPHTYEGQFLFLFQGIGDFFVRDEKIRREKLIFLLNKKLELNAKRIKQFIDASFSFGLLFNYRQKVRIDNCFNASDKTHIEKLLLELNVSESKLEQILSFFLPESDSESIEMAVELITEDEKKDEVLEALWGGYLYLSFEENAVHKFNLKKDDGDIDFFEYLTKNFEKNLTRNLSLQCLKIDNLLLSKFPTFDEFLNSLLNYVTSSYKRLSNHSYLSILIKSDLSPSIIWTIYGKVVLFAEKFKSEKVKIGYFHPDKIAKQTENHISELDINKCQFQNLNEGFTYKDCLVLTPTIFENGKTEYSFQGYDILILFEKNERDETLIPCPACRSKDVRGNSYPVLGVKSWECNNIICPDRSKYNRGKRYSLASLIKQEAIENPANQIEIEHLRKWRLDVTTIKSEMEVLELLFKHYTLSGDNVELSNFNIAENSLFCRKVMKHEFQINSHCRNELSFFDSAFFSRFIVDKSSTSNQTKYANLSRISGVELYEGDCYDVLKSIVSEKFDGAVTSPPYYNAKNYSQWANIYCYLYDMYNIGKEVYRTLKEGAPYLFNIFDYFDNENSTVFSAMGDKRMILGSYIIEIFERIGFQLIDNIIWHKGEIQGKRNFNQGNNSPYYQTPLNCYEHILLFSKNNPNFELNYPKILKAKPVMKMVKGVNTLGHEAPYPVDIPKLLFNLIPVGSTILDPFAGSLTTAKACCLNGYQSVNIEYKAEYCKLGLELLNEELGLFSQQLLIS